MSYNVFIQHKNTRHRLYGNIIDKSCTKLNKKIKTHASISQIAKTIIAYEVITSAEENDKSLREAAKILNTPKSTLYDRLNKKNQDIDELAQFVYNVPCISKLNERILIALMVLLKTGHTGIRAVQWFLKFTNLSRFIASSEGALQKLWNRIEDCFLEFNEIQEKKLATSLNGKKIIAVLDEIFRGGRPCLVAIEAISGYVLLEKFTDDGTADTWKNELGLCSLTRTPILCYHSFPPFSPASRLLGS